MKTSTKLGLLSIFLLALLLRLSPVLNSPYWGADYGEYYHLSSDLIALGRMPDQYYGWGIVYPDFAGMEMLSSASSLMSGGDLTVFVSLVAPVLAALSVVFVFLISVELFRDERMGLMAAALVGVAMPHVYPTSHPIPAAVGDLIFAACLLLFVKIRTNRGFIVPLALISLGLVITHHLSTYFLVICVVAAIFLKAVYAKKPRLSDFGTSLGFAAYLTGITLAYWMLAKNFRNAVLSDSPYLPWWAAVAVLPLAVVFLVLFILVRGRTRPLIKLRFQSYTSSFSYWLVAFTSLVAIVLLLVVVAGIPGTSMRVGLVDVLLFMPLMVALSFSAFGRQYMEFHREGLGPTAWAMAIIASFIAGSLFAPEVIIPYRHIEYLVIPLGIMAAFGIVVLYDYLRFSGDIKPGKDGDVTLDPRTERKPARRSAAVAVSLALALVLMNAATAFPSRSAMLGHFESTGSKSVEAVVWVAYGTPVEGTVASDHRLSSIVFGFANRNSTWGGAPITIMANTFEEALPEMENVSLPSGHMRIDYVLIDGDVVNGAMLSVWDPAVPLSQAAVDKFQGNNYTKLFDNGFARLYMVNW